ncbi:MAG: ribonuclease P protein component [Bacilli bacterium]|nr:ribonuclease P protein component [Bacilli bacterium]
MRKLYIVKRKEEFDNIINKCPYKKTNSFVIYYKDNEYKYDRFGISVGKKIGNAVVRNSYKRKIRSIIDNYKKSYNNQEDYIIILRRSALDKSYNELEIDFNNIMQNIRKDICNEKK